MSEGDRVLAGSVPEDYDRRNEIEARDAGKLEAATDHAASEIANRHGSGPIAAKIQAHIVTAVA